MENERINDTESIREEIEREYTLRFNDLNDIENFLVASDATDEFQSLYRKMLIVMLYAYYEGFCKKALEIYAEYVNATHEYVKDLKYEIASATLRDEFEKLENRNYLPVRIRGEAIKQDNVLQRFGRRSEFFEAYEKNMGKKVNLPDNIVDTESNLSPHVLKSLLYRLSLDYTIVDSVQGNINKLVGLRNSIAHGDIVREFTEEEYKECKNAVFEVMDNLKQEIIEKYRIKGYLNTSA